MSDISFRPIMPEDRDWIAKLLTEHWGSPIIISRGKIHDACELHGFVALSDNERVGLVTFRIDGKDCELVTLDSLKENFGIGTNLIDAVMCDALKAGCSRLWLITTNDNLHALGFYQKRGFHFAAIYPNALDESRKIKPTIPEFGMHGIPLRDEIELEIQLT